MIASCHPVPRRSDEPTGWYGSDWGTNTTDTCYIVYTDDYATTDVDVDDLPRKPRVVPDLSFLYRAPVVKAVDRKPRHLIFQPAWRKGRWKSKG